METQTKQNEMLKITGNWDVQGKKLKEKYPQLTDEDWKFEVGKEEELLKRVKNRLGKQREEVISIITKAQPENV